MVSIEELLRGVAERNAADTRADHDQAIRDFTEICRRHDESPREQQRIRDIADLIEAEDAIYDQALAALDRGDHDTAVLLLRQAAEMGIGEAAWRLAVLLEEAGDTYEAVNWYRRAAEDGDSRASAKVAEHAAGLDWQLKSSAVEPMPPEAEPMFPEAEVRVVPDGAISCELADLPDMLAEVRNHLVPRAALESFRFEHVFFFPAACKMAIHEAVSIKALDEATKASLSGVLLPGRRQRERARSATHFEVALRPGWPVGLPTTEELRYWLDQRQYEALSLVPYLAPHHPVESSARFYAAERFSGAPRLTAADVMVASATIPALGTETNMHEALEIILQAGTGALPICDEGGLVIGVVTLTDLARRVYEDYGAASIQRVDTLMHPPLMVTPDTPVAAVAAAVTKEGNGFAVVIAPHGRPAGYITADTLLEQPLAGSRAGAYRSNPASSLVTVADLRSAVEPTAGSYAADMH